MENENKKSLNQMSLDELKEQFNNSAAKIRNITSKITDKRNLADEDKRTLRIEYVSMAEIAKKISQRSTDEAEIDKFKDLAKRASEKAASYGSSINSYVPETTFDDVKGLDNVKDMVKSFLFMSNHQDIISYYHIKGGLGMLMYGAPGTGKTLFAEAIAHEMNLPLFVVTPADIFKPHVGESEESVKSLFEDIDASPDGAVLFVDECESIFSVRSSDTQDYKAAVTTELLQRINGFGRDGSKRIMIAATNRPQDIDPAYLRYKRFSHLVHVTPPDAPAKRAIIESKLKGIALDGITVDDILNMSEDKTSRKDGTKFAYYSAADVSAIIEEACRIAIEKIQKENINHVLPLTKEMFVDAFNKIRASISGELLEEYSSFGKKE